MHAATPRNDATVNARVRSGERFTALLAAAGFLACLALTVQACGDDLVLSGDIPTLVPNTQPAATATPDPDDF